MAQQVATPGNAVGAGVGGHAAARVLHVQLARGGTGVGGDERLDHLRGVQALAQQAQPA